MYFPSGQQIIGYHTFFLVTGPLLLLLSGMLWIWLIRSLRQVPRPVIDGRVLIFAIMTLLIGSVHFFATYSRVVQAVQSHYALADVQELRITRLANEHAQPTGASLILTDRSKLLQGLALLGTAQARQRNHEGFSNGYRVQIVLRGTGTIASRYLSVFQTSNGSQPVSVVILQSPSSLDDVAEFSSPDFLRWIQEVMVSSP